MKILFLFAVLLTGLEGVPAVAATSVLVVTGGGVTRQFTADNLLAWHDAATVVVPHDPSYGRTMSYLAVPLCVFRSNVITDSGGR